MAAMSMTANHSTVRGSGVPRDELFITTKLWIQDPGEANAGPQGRESLAPEPFRGSSPDSVG